MRGLSNLGNDIVRIDASGQTRPFPRYSYVVAGGGHAAIIDPGPREDFASTYALLQSVIPPGRLSFIILTSETPDACSSLPLWKQAGFTGTILAHWKAELLARSYGRGLAIRTIRSAREPVDIGGGRVMTLVNVPGIPTAGSLFCFDGQSGSLFTGMLFGAADPEEGSAGSEAADRLASFHRLMFPAMGARPDIGELLQSLRPASALPRNGPPVDVHLPQVAALFAPPLLAAPAGNTGDLLEEVARLRAENLELQKSIIQASDDQIKDPVTGFYNETFFEEYVDSLVPSGDDAELPPDSVAFIRLDGIQRLNQRFGAKAGDAALKGLGHLLVDNKSQNAIFFRMNGPLFACYLQGTAKGDAVSYASTLKGVVEKSDGFVDRITISAAIVELAELGRDRVDSGRLHAGLMKVGKERLKLLDKLGPNSICFDSSITLRRSSGTVLLIESSPFEADLLRRVLERQGFETHVVTRGSEAIPQADLYRPEVIVSEIFVPQMDGFQIRQRLMASPDLRNVPFILISRDKSEATVQRALNLGISHFFRKPFMAVELAGIIRLLIGEQSGERH